MKKMSENWIKRYIKIEVSTKKYTIYLLKKAKIDKNSIKLLMKQYIDFKNEEFIYIGFEEDSISLRRNFYGRSDKESFWIQCNYIFSGSFNLRKEKLLKINNI